MGGLLDGFDFLTVGKNDSIQDFLCALGKGSAKGGTWRILYPRSWFHLSSKEQQIVLVSLN